MTHNPAVYNYSKGYIRHKKAPDSFEIAKTWKMACAGA